ncbi:hypothetical protein GCM10011404_29930 [Sphingomonas prati]|nr:hypothetical protein GCM10011404_29930 [Sphingomonas prati]
MTNRPVFITYSLETTSSALLGNGQLRLDQPAFIDSFKPLNASQASVARSAFSIWDAASGITFLEVPAGLGDIKLATFNFDLGGFYNSSQADAYGGGGIVYVSATYPEAGIQLFLHEIGHNLGFKHSFEGEYVLGPSQDNFASTVMSYTSGGTAGTVLGSIDQRAVSYLYGQPGSDGRQVAAWSWDAENFTLTQNAFAGGGTILGVGGNNNINGAGGADIVEIEGNTRRNQISTGAGDDIVTISATASNNVVSVGDGADRISLRPGGSFTIDGGAGLDTLSFTADYSIGANFSVATALENGSRIDSIESIFLVGSSLGNDRFVASNANTGIYGFGGDDDLSGGNGNDNIFGYDGNDTLRGGLGRDYLSGGIGNDLYAGTASELTSDTIGDFSLGDTISFQGVSPTALGYSLIGSTLRYAGGSLTLNGLTGSLRLASGAQGEAALIVRNTAHVTNLGDFGGDGNSDILWRNRDGSLSVWGVSGDLRGNVVQQSVFNTRLGTDWKLIDTADFNGDAKSDLLWRNDNGTVATWNATAGGQIATGGYTASVGAEWTIAAVGDFGGDRKDDLLWRNADGSVSIWSGSSGDFAVNTYSHGSVNTDWRIQGAADFTGDGRADILWRNSSGATTVWSASGNGFSENGFNASVGREWHVDGMGDFNGDGRADMLWRNDNGAVSVWTSNGSEFDQAVFDTSVATEWRIASIKDFNSDGRADILWQNANGAITSWQSNGPAFDQQVLDGYNPGSDWAVIGHEYIL